MYQKTTIIGNIGSAPEMRYMPDGTPVTSFSVATNRKWTTKDGQQGEETVWFRVSAWRKLAEICNQYLSKGRQVMVEGRLTADKETGGPKIWTGNDGNPRASFELMALDIKFLGSATTQQESAQDKTQGQKTTSTQQQIQYTEDEIPF